MALEAAARAVAEALNQPGATQTRLIELLEQHTSFTLRSPQQEAALRGLVRLADVAADQGIAETVRLDDAPMWLHAKFLERRKSARVQLKSAELCEFLADAYANLCSLGDQRGECQAVRIPEAAPDNWPVGPAVVFTWTGDEPHPAIEDMLDAMDVQWVRTQYHGRDAILGFLTEAHVMGQDVLASGPV